jgi:uncharacterized protein HemX
MSRRSRIAGFGSAGLLVLLGIACAVVFSGALGQNLAFVLVALGLVLATSLVFYEVGLTEDRARAREDKARRREEARRREAEREAAAKLDDAKRGHAEERSPRIRLGRSRGRPRRLR